MWLTKLANLQQLSYLFTFIVSTIAVIFLQSDCHNRIKRKIANPDYFQQERELLTALNYKNAIPAFGFDNLFADSLYLEFVQYFGDETAREATGYTLVTPYFAAIARRDPQFTEAYLNLATANSMYAGKADETVNLLNKILPSTSTEIKNSHLLWTTKAIDETIFLGDTGAAKISYETAARSALENSHEALKIFNYNQQKARFLATEPDTTQAQITAWKSVLPHVVKETEKQAIRDRISTLEAKLN